METLYVVVNDYFIPIYCILPKKCVVKEISISKRWIRNLHKEIYKRPEMVHLLKDCKKGAVNLIFSQTRAYLAANTCDFCFLLKYLFDLPMRVDIVTDDDDQRIDTILDVENQRQNLKELAEKYTSIRRKDYLEWRIRLEDEMTKAEEK